MKKRDRDTTRLRYSSFDFDGLNQDGTLRVKITGLTSKDTRKVVELKKVYSGELLSMVNSFLIARREEIERKTRWTQEDLEGINDEIRRVLETE